MLAQQKIQVLFNLLVRSIICKQLCSVCRQQISLSVTTGHYNCTKISKKMGSKALLMLKGVSSIAPKNQIFNFNRKSSRSSNSSFSFSKVVINHNNKVRRCSTTTTQSSLEPPDVSRLAETARISLTPNEVYTIDWWL